MSWEDLDGMRIRAEINRVDFVTAETCWCGKPLKNGCCKGMAEKRHREIDAELRENPVCWCGSRYGVQRSRGALACANERDVAHDAVRNLASMRRNLIIIRQAEDPDCVNLRVPTEKFLTRVIEQLNVIGSQVREFSRPDG